MRNGIKSASELKNEALFMKTLRGIPTDVVAYAFSKLSPGINWVGCGKAHMAEEWANENESNIFRSRGGVKMKAALVDIYDEAIRIHKQRVANRNQKLQWQAEASARRQREAAEEKADDETLAEVFEAAIDRLEGIADFTARQDVKRFKALRKKLLG